MPVPLNPDDAALLCAALRAAVRGTLRRPLHRVYVDHADLDVEPFVLAVGRVWDSVSAAHVLCARGLTTHENLCFELESEALLVPVEGHA